jgi:hypothetical protein
VEPHGALPADGPPHRHRPATPARRPPRHADRVRRR